MEQKHGIPKRIKREDKPGQTKKFIKVCIMLWLFEVVILILDQGFGLYSGFQSEYGLLNWIVSAIGIFILVIITCLPVIILFSILLRWMEKGVKKTLDK